MNIKKIVISSATVTVIALASAAPAFAVAPGAVVKNPNANANACWGQDRSYYASSNYFPENQSLNQSFPGDLGEQRAAWVATYCEPHQPAQ